MSRTSWLLLFVANKMDGSPGLLKIVDVEFNDINGGSFLLVISKAKANFKFPYGLIKDIVNNEKSGELHTSLPYKNFEKRMHRHSNRLKRVIHKLNSENKRTFGYGASTKGNVLLQLCDFCEADIPFIAEVNKNKFDHYTPKTNIPIICERKAKSMNPDYFLVLPWHFKESILSKEASFLSLK